MISDNNSRVCTPLFPTYSTVITLLPLLNGVPRSSVTSLIARITEQMGSRTDPVDWSDPDEWIPVRLSGTDEALAHRIWSGSMGTINPRYIRGPHFLASHYKLIDPDDRDVYTMTERGRAFSGRNHSIVREVEESEGLVRLLEILAPMKSAKRADLLPEWAEYLHRYSTWGTPSTTRDTLSRRLANLVDRGLVLREGITYSIAGTGVVYLGETRGDAGGSLRATMELAEQFNAEQKELLRCRLEKIDPFRFGSLVSDLLEAMGYEDVVVTRRSNDKDVDVVAKVQFGITIITEVVQVKRHQRNIRRDVLDQLRGAFPYHGALRGTLITLGGFSKGCKSAAVYPGAAPITLIDGDRLLSLLVEHEVGTRKKTVCLCEVDEEYFTSPNEINPPELTQPRGPASRDRRD